MDAYLAGHVGARGKGVVRQVEKGFVVIILQAETQDTSSSGCGQSQVCFCFQAAHGVEKGRAIVALQVRLGVRAAQATSSADTHKSSSRQAKCSYGSAPVLDENSLAC
jgi:hypothetical protein